MTDAAPNPRRRPGIVRRRSRRFGAVLLLAFVKAILLVAVPVGLAWWLHSSWIFRVAEVRVVTDSDRVAADWAAERLGPLEGAWLLGVSAERVQTLLGPHSWIEGVAVKKTLPSEIEVELLERVPAALLRRDGRLFYLDRGGRIIAPFDPEAGGAWLHLVAWEGKLPVPIEVFDGVVAELTSVRPEWVAGLDEVELLGGLDVVVHSTAVGYPLVLREGRLDEGIARLERVRTELESLDARIAAVDVRFDRRVIVTPASPVEPKKRV